MSQGAPALAGALVTGASVFLQALVVLKVTEAVQEAGVSLMLAFGVGQGLIGGVTSKQELIDLYEASPAR